MKALLFGSIGTLVETSEIQRQSYNLAFKDEGLDWYWNVATYCQLLSKPGGIKRVTNFSQNTLSKETIHSIHSKKEKYFEKLIINNLTPRNGVKNLLKLCQNNKIKVGFITTTSVRNISNIKKGLANEIDFSKFELITSKEDVKNPKPDEEVYRYALNILKVKNKDAIAIEDTSINKNSSIKAGIKCLLFPGEYAVVKNNEKVTYNIDKEIEALI